MPHRDSISVCPRTANSTFALHGFGLPGLNMMKGIFRGISVDRLISEVLMGHTRPSSDRRLRSKFHRTAGLQILDCFNASLPHWFTCTSAFWFTYRLAGDVADHITSDGAIEPMNYRHQLKWAVQSLAASSGRQRHRRVEDRELVHAGRRTATTTEFDPRFGSNLPEGNTVI